MADRPDLISLAERVEAATGADRELDAEIAVAVDGGEIIWKQANYTMETYPARRHKNPSYIGGYCNGHVPAYTSSVDAVLALIAERLSYAGWTIGTRDIGVFHADITIWSGTAATPALALLAAALRALAAQSDADAKNGREVDRG